MAGFILFDRHPKRTCAHFVSSWASIYVVVSVAVAVVQFSAAGYPNASSRTWGYSLGKSADIYAILQTTTVQSPIVQTQALIVQTLRRGYAIVTRQAHTPLGFCDRAFCA